MRKTRIVALLAAAAAALAAPAAAGACENAGKQPHELTPKQARASVMCLMNQRRRAHGLRKLRHDPRLERAAQRHSQSMDRSNYFSHSSPGGSSPLSRIRSTGYLSGASSWGIAENIRWGSQGRGSPKTAVNQWMRSPSHRAAILSGSYREAGVGVAIGSPTGSYEGNAAIYTATFGYRH